MVPFTEIMSDGPHTTCIASGNTAKERVMKAPTHAGAVVYRNGQDKKEFLLVTAKSDRSLWVLPKGHIDPGETPEQTAVRETREEAGVDSEVVRLIGRSTFTQRGAKARVDYFLTHYIGDVEPEEDRNVRWFSFEKALKKLPYDNLKNVLRLARDMLD